MKYITSIGKFGFLLASLGLLFSHTAVAGDITPSHVYEQTGKIIAEITLLRDKLGATDTPRLPGVQTRKKPIHVYAKSLEVLEKIARAQSKHGLTPIIVGHIPMRKIPPAEVFKSTEIILAEIGRLKAKLGITAHATGPAFADGKTPSDVYENMWTASYMLDAVAGQISPSFVYRNTLLIGVELAQIAAKLGVSLTTNPPAAIAGKTPKDVNLQAFKNLHLLSRLQRKLKIPPLRVPSFPAGDISPSDVYDSTNNTLAELVRIKVALGITTARDAVAEVAGKKPADVLAQMQLIGDNMKAITATQ